MFVCYLVSVQLLQKPRTVSKSRVTVRTQLWQPLSAYERHHTISGVDKLRWLVTACIEYSASV